MCLLQPSAVWVPAGDVLCLSNESRHCQSGHGLVPRIVAYKNMPAGSVHIWTFEVQGYSILFKAI